MEFGYKEEKDSPFREVIKEWPILLIEIIVAVLLGFLLVRFGFEKTIVSGVSMEPTLKEQDCILINKMSYKLLSPKHNDVIVYKLEEKEHEYYSVKRVVGLPGETIQIKDGILYVNGEAYKEKVDVEEMITAGVAEDEITLEKGEYFVLGDNRNQSEDSRYSSVGMITKRDIIGKAWLRLKPSFGIISWLSYKEEDAKEK